MPSVLLDPFIVASPSSGGTADEIISQVREILEWAAVDDEGWLPLCVSCKTTKCLMDENLYPLYPHIDERLKAAGVDVYDAGTIVTALDRFLNKAGTFEDHLGVADVLLEPFHLTPSLGDPALCPGLRTELERCIGVVAVVTQVIPERTANHRVATMIPSNVSGRLRAQGSVQAVVSDGPNRIPDVPMGKAVDCEVHLCRTLDECLLSLDPIALFRRAPDETRLGTAIRLEVFRTARGSGQGIRWADTSRFVLGNSFLSSFPQYGFDTNHAKIERLLRACAATVLGTNLNAVHAIRTGKGKGGTPLTKGNEKAKRRDIDYDFHLHYWDRGNLPPRFANIAIEQDLRIDD